MVALLAEKTPVVRTHAMSWRGLPPRMRVLYIATRQRTGGWLAEALAADSASHITIEEAVGTSAGLARLRDEAFDAVLVSHDPAELDALDLIEGYRASGANEPIIVLGMQSEQEMAALCYEVGADGYVCVHTTTTRNLVWVMARAVQRHQLVRENHRLTLAEDTRQQRECDEAARVLNQQRALLRNLGVDEDQTSKDSPPQMPFLPEEFIAHYRELLRTYVIMGTGNLGGDLQRIAELLVSAGISAAQTMQLHLHVLRDLVHGLGARSTRHVITRADLLVLELLLHLAEGYRNRYDECLHPPTQQRLLGFD